MNGGFRENCSSKQSTDGVLSFSFCVQLKLKSSTRRLMMICGGVGDPPTILITTLSTRMPWKRLMQVYFRNRFSL